MSTIVATFKSSTMLMGVMGVMGSMGSMGIMRSMG